LKLLLLQEEVDAGAILVQEVVRVEPGDTETSLAERVKTVEHQAYPKALQLLASGAISESGTLNGQ
jgi:folate-dependent phosphoribosylglycinamide formyltransferase PurN